MVADVEACHPGRAQRCGGAIHTVAEGAAETTSEDGGVGIGPIAELHRPGAAARDSGQVACGQDGVGVRIDLYTFGMRGPCRPPCRRCRASSGCRAWSRVMEEEAACP